MKQNVRLFIEDYEVDLGSSPNVLFNYTETELTNPTIIKNGYSKTVALPGTPQNSYIFGEIWNLERTQVNGTTEIIGTAFNPSKKVEYKLYADNEIVESGYLKMNSINKKKDIVVFNITLYSGIGDFFYSLSYNADGEKLKLSDLTFLLSSETYNGVTYTEQAGDANEFNMTITRQNLYNAWNYWGWVPTWPAGFDRYRKFSYINFAPCYNAIPTDNFSADKVLVNFSGGTLSSSTTSGGKTYTSKNGFALGTLPEKMDEWAVRDLRSYLQRPVLRVKGLINAICAYAADQGYSVELSPTFFRDDNPYWNDTWLTMPMLTEMKLVGSDADATKQNVTFSMGWNSTSNGWYESAIQIIPSPALNVGSQKIEVTMDFSTSSRTDIRSELYTSAYVNGERNFCAYAIQLLALAGTDTFSTVVAASDVAWLTSKIGTNDYLTPSETMYTAYNDAGYYNVFGTFHYDSNEQVFKWSTGITLTIDAIPSNTEAFAIRITTLANLAASATGSGQSYGYRRGRCYTATALTSLDDSNNVTLPRTLQENVADLTGVVTLKSSTAGYSGARVSKATLLNTENTPADYLISFCKIWGLYFLKNPHNKVIKILTRGEFFNDSDVVDIQELIDRSDLNINPVTFDKKYYDLELASVGGEFSDKYTTTYSRTYGSQRIDTGYEFDTEPKAILSGNTFKTCVVGTQKSKYYLSPIGDSGKTPSYIYQDFKYLLYNGTAASGTTVEMVPEKRVYEFPSLGGEMYYDAFPKPQFRDAEGKAVKGENTLLFYNGFKQCRNSNSAFTYYLLTDDLAIMGQLNEGNPCYIYSELTTSSAGTICTMRYSLPQFSRYKISGDTILYSLDFGEPRQLYIDGLSSYEYGTVYSRYWKKYIADLYDVNNRVVTAKVQLEKRPSQELLRKWYWFDNSYWRLNKIKDFDVCSYEPTECEFIKVKSLNAYTDTVSSIYLSASQTSLDVQGGSVDFEIECEGPWSLGGTNSGYFSGLPSSGYGNTTFTATLGANTATDGRQITVRATNAEDGQYSEVYIEQAGSAFRLYISDSAGNPLSGTIKIPPTGGTFYMTIISDFPWDMSYYTSSTCTISPSTGIATAGTTMTITVGPRVGSEYAVIFKATNSLGRQYMYMIQWYIE